MQAPAHHAVEHISLTPGKFPAVEVWQQDTNGAPELLFVEVQVFRVSLLEDLHSHVKSEPIAIEQGESLGMAEEILRKDHLDEGNTHANAPEIKLGTQRAVKYEAIESWMRRATQLVDLRQFLHCPIMTWHPATIDDEGIQSGSDPGRHLLVEGGMQDDVRSAVTSG